MAAAGKPPLTLRGPWPQVLKSPADALCAPQNLTWKGLPWSQWRARPVPPSRSCRSPCHKKSCQLAQLFSSAVVRSKEDGAKYTLPAIIHGKCILSAGPRALQYFSGRFSFFMTGERGQPPFWFERQGLGCRAGLLRKICFDVFCVAGRAEFVNNSVPAARGDGQSCRGAGESSRC